jgi:hypothetical protein
MVLESYFDDSADPRRDRYYACGGFIGGPDQFDAFEVNWSHLTSGLREPFRSTDCETGHGQFQGVPKPARDKLMDQLVGVLFDTKLRGFASIVPVQDYKECFPTSGQHDPFLLALRHVIMNMAFIANELKYDMRLWFEQSAINSSIERVYQTIANWRVWEPSKRLRDIRFESKKCKPLQAADLIAREAFKHMDNLGTRPTRIPVRRLGEQGALYFVLWNKPALSYLAANGGASNLELLSQWDALPNAPRLGPVPIR